MNIYLYIDYNIIFSSDEKDNIFDTYIFVS